MGLNKVLIVENSNYLTKSNASQSSNSQCRDQGSHSPLTQPASPKRISELQKSL